jgi:hypothetical protein
MWPFSETNAAAMCTQNQQRVTSRPRIYRGFDPDAVAETHADHFGNCPVCGALLDMRDLGQVMEHVHDTDLEIGARWCRDGGRDVSLRPWRSLVVGHHGLPSQLHSKFGAAFRGLHLRAGRNAELRKLMVGFAAAGPLPWHSPRGGRNTDAHATCAALHAEPGVDHIVAGVLVLDVGRSWCNLGHSHAGYPEDRF